MSNTNKVVMNLISNKMENKKYHTSRTVTKSNNEKQKNTTLPEQSQNPIMKNKKYHTSRTVSKSNNEKQKIPHFQNSFKSPFVTRRKMNSGYTSINSPFQKLWDYFTFK